MCTSCPFFARNFIPKDDRSEELTPSPCGGEQFEAVCYQLFSMYGSFIFLSSRAQWKGHPPGRETSFTSFYLCDIQPMTSPIPWGT